MKTLKIAAGLAHAVTHAVAPEAVAVPGPVPGLGTEAETGAGQGAGLDPVAPQRRSPLDPARLLTSPQ